MRQCFKVFYQQLPPKLKLKLDVARGNRQPFLEEMDMRKSIFIHIPKAAGTSISNEIFFGKQVGHFKSEEYKFIDSEKFRKYYKFSICRHPFTRFKSAFDYLKCGGGNDYDREFYERNKKFFCSYEVFVEELSKNKNFKKWVHFIPQVDFIYTNGALSVDFLGRFENISVDYNEVRKRLSLQVKPLVETNKSNGGDELSDAVKLILKEIYREDFEMLGYE